MCSTPAEDPLTRARLRGLQARTALLQAEGGVLGASEVADYLGITCWAVEIRRQGGALFGIPMVGQGYRYPAWQFDTPYGVLPGLREVLLALHGLDPWMQIAFMLNGNVRLSGESPLTLLRRGVNDSVILAAQAFGEHGAA